MKITVIAKSSYGIYLCTSYLLHLYYILRFRYCFVPCVWRPHHRIMNHLMMQPLGSTIIKNSKLHGKFWCNYICHGRTHWISPCLIYFHLKQTTWCHSCTGKKNMQEENINPTLLSPWVGRKPKPKALPVYLNRPNTEPKT